MTINTQKIAYFYHTEALNAVKKHYKIINTVESLKNSAYGVGCAMRTIAVLLHQHKTAPPPLERMNTTQTR